MSLRSEDVKRAVYRYCSQNRMVSVSECTLGKYDSCGRSDVVGMKFPSRYSFLTPDGPGEFEWVVEFEVKVSKQDLLKDIEKRRWWFWRASLPCTHFYYAVPRALEQEALQAADDLMQMLRGKGKHGDRMTGDRMPKIGSRARVGVLVVDDEYTFEVVRNAVRFQKAAPVESINKMIGRSFWELHKMRGVDASPHVDRRKELVSVGQIWQLSRWHHRRRKGVFEPPKVRVVDIKDGKVHAENVKTGRKSRSKVAGFCKRYRLREEAPSALSD